MRNNSLRKTFFLFFVTLTAFSAHGQQKLFCGNGPINESALNAAINYERNVNRPDVVNYLVRVYFHVFHDDNGTGGAATLAQIKTEFTSLLATYASDNVCFLFAGIDSFNNTTLNRNFNADSDPTGIAMSGVQIPDCINIFYMQAILGNNTACNPPCGYGGIALGGIPGTFFLVATGNIGLRSTIGHEMGHNLGLLHTFEKNFGFEKIDGSNASSTGDKITDTPADPYAYNGNACFTTAAPCIYNGTCTDPDGAVGFTPPYTNLMSYWCTGGPATTTNQFTRVNSILTTNVPVKNCTSPNSLVVNAMTISSGFYMKSAITTLSTLGNVLINGGTKATLGGGLILLEPGFHASPTGTGITYVVTKPCN